MKRVLLDQGLPAGAASSLRECGWDAVHVREIGMHSASDRAILDRAAAESRVVVTLGRDFPQILALTAATGPSVVLIRWQRLQAANLVELVTSVWNDHETSLNKGCVLRVSARGTRIRSLPYSFL
jgi:predicted nuclease of predicted toxin-antitoxin system